AIDSFGQQNYFIASSNGILYCTPSCTPVFSGRQIDHVYTYGLDAWACGDYGQALRRNQAGGWDSLLTTELVRTIDAFAIRSDATILAVGEGIIARRDEPGGWKVVFSPPFDLRGVTLDRAGDAWAVGAGDSIAYVP